MLSDAQKIALKLLNFEFRRGCAIENEYVIEHINGEIAAIKRFQDNYWRIYTIEDGTSHLLPDILQLDSEHYYWDV